MDIENRILKLEKFTGIEQRTGTVIFVDSMDPEEVEMKMQEAAENGYRSVVVFPRKISNEEWERKVAVESKQAKQEAQKQTISEKTQEYTTLDS